MLSVVIVAKDEDQTLPVVLDDLWHQTSLPDELLVVDDSPGVREYRTLYPTMHYAKGPGKGAAVARNLGASLTTGDLLFIDADVRLPSNAIEMVREGARTHRAMSAHNTESVIPALDPPYLWGGFSYLERGLFNELGGWPIAYVEDWVMTKKLEAAKERIYVLPLMVGLQRGTRDVLQKGFSMVFLNGETKP